MRRRLAEVARHVGVSEATVSRVLNERPGVSPSDPSGGAHGARRARLRATDAAARRAGPTRRAGAARVAEPDLPGGRRRGGRRARPERVHAGAVHADRRRHHRSGVRRAAPRPTGVGRGVRRRPVRPGAGAARPLRDPRRAQPARWCSSTPPSIASGSRRVSCDDAMATEQAFDHLVALGHRHIALLLGPADHVPSNRKLAAAVSAAAPSRASSSPTDRVARAMFSPEGGQAAGDGLVATGATAVLCASDPLALGAIRAVRRRGLQVPADVSVVGFDDSALMRFTDPPLTTVRQPIEAMGRAAVERLDQPARRRPRRPDGAAVRPRARRPRVHRARLTAATHAAARLHSARNLLRLSAKSRDFLQHRVRSASLAVARADTDRPHGDRAATTEGDDNVMARSDARDEREWWRHALIYQIYLRSFADANGDGVGDLAGVRSRLGYLRDLGVDAIWFNPWYVSPLADGGYDVADYRDIDPLFGTLAEAERLIAEALTLGIRTIIDIVPNHVSDRHPWFVEALDGGSRLAVARPLLVPAGQGRRRQRAAERLAVALRRLGVDPHQEPRRVARRLVPAPVRAGPARPQLGPPRRTRRARGHPALLVRPRRRRRAHRLGGAGAQRPRSPGAPRPDRRRQPPVRRPRRAPRAVPRVAAHRRQPTTRHAR